MVSRRTKVLDLELGRPIESVTGLRGYRAVRFLVRFLGSPLGYLELPLNDGRCSAEEIWGGVAQRHNWRLFLEILTNALVFTGASPGLRLEDGLARNERVKNKPRLSVTVAVCTRDRAGGLARCLRSIERLNYSPLEVLVIDNAPSSERARRFVESSYPDIRYVREPRPGLDWARNRAILEARGDLVAFTDDDVVVDPEWIGAIASTFERSAEISAVTGFVAPFELETDAQQLFEAAGGFGNGQGFEEIWYYAGTDRKMSWRLVAKPGLFGTGANMAFRRSVFDDIGLFDPALDVGTLTNGAGDLEMFHRVLKAGHVLVYEPRAIVRHRHRRTYEELRKQKYNNGSVFAYIVSTISRYSDERVKNVRLLLWWFWSWHIRNFVRAAFGRAHLPFDLVRAEFLGCLRGLLSYARARRVARSIVAQHGKQAESAGYEIKKFRTPVATNRTEAIRYLDLSEPMESLDGLEKYEVVRVYVMRDGKPLGIAWFDGMCESIDVDRLAAGIAHQLNLTLLDRYSILGRDVSWSEVIAFLNRTFAPSIKRSARLSQRRLSAKASVSIVVATSNRPEKIDRCVRRLMAQRTRRRDLEIIVVDNNPSAGQVAPILARYDGVRLVEESRPGVSYARNAGILASSGEIIVVTDDDVEVPVDWLENLIAPFVESRIMCVTGNTFPISVDSPAQFLFERFGDGGLGRGFERFEVDSNWFHSFGRHPVPTWILGGTANAAFRAEVFSNPQMGLMKETLGPGMPSGIGEDMFCLYKILRAGYSIVYEPRAYVWHEHRASMKAVSAQLFAYAKGIVAYHLTTLFIYRDFRALYAILVGLPKWQLSKIGRRLRGHSEYPVRLVCIEILGNLMGPWALLRSYLRVRRFGRSPPYVPPAHRSSEMRALSATSRGTSD